MHWSSWLYGLIGGIIVSFYYSVLYIIHQPLIFDPWWYWGAYLFYLGTMVIYAIHKRREGIFRMRDVTNSTFRVFLMISIIYYVFHYILYTWIDPDLLELQKETILIEMDESLREQFKQSIEQGEDGIQLSNLLLKFALNLIFGFILSAFLAPIFKRDTV